MNIVYSSDDNYARHLASSMASLMDHNRQEPEIHIWILNVGLSEDNIRKLTQVVESFGRTIHVVDFSDIRERFPAERIPLNSFTIETYTRIFLPDALPETEHRAMWIDGDTAVLGNIHDLYYCDMGDNAVAAVVDQPNFGLAVSKEDAGYTDGPYFAAGMFVANLDVWRRENVIDRLIAYFAERGGVMLFMDQTLMNHVLRGRIYKLPFRCHVITPAYFLTYRQMCKKWGEPFYSRKEFVQGKRHPLVVHYAVFRPWKRWCLHPMKRYYRRYLKKTPYKDVPLEAEPLLPVLKKIVSTVLYRLHLVRS